jgi:hypothetical protein
MIHPMDTLKEDEKYIYIKPCANNQYKNCMVKASTYASIWYPYFIWSCIGYKYKYYFYKDDFIIINTKEEYDKFEKIVVEIFN